MSSKRKQSLEDLINEPKVVALAGQSYSYGQTPAALCRQHFKEIAKGLNMTVEELAKGVLNKSLGEQLCMLRDFYKSQNEETGVIYQPLLELSSADIVDNDTIRCKTTKKKSKTGKTAEPSVQKKTKPCPMILSSDSDSEDINRAVPVPLNKGIQANRHHLNKRMLINSKTLSRVESSIEATVAFERESCSEKKKLDEKLPKNSFPEPKIAELEVNPAEVMPFSDFLANEPVTKETTQKPPIVIKQDIVPMIEEGPQDDLETFLYGKNPTRSKPPPKKKAHRYPLSQSSSETTVVLDGSDTLPSSQFCPPALTFEPLKPCSPSSRQRDLLSVARDIAALKKVVASGKKLGDSVSDTIKFTNSIE